MTTDKMDDKDLERMIDIIGDGELLAMLIAMRRASSRVSNPAAVRRPGSVSRRGSTPARWRRGR